MRPEQDAKGALCHVITFAFSILRVGSSLFQRFSRGFLVFSSLENTIMTVPETAVKLVDCFRLSVKCLLLMVTVENDRRASSVVIFNEVIQVTISLIKETEVRLRRQVHK